MNFQQLNSALPYFEHVHLYRSSQLLDVTAGLHAIVIVRRGHVTITPGDDAPFVCSQGYACNPEHGPFQIETPRTKEAEYVVIGYRMLPEGAKWSLAGPLNTFSEVKIHYMVDELLRQQELYASKDEASSETHDSNEAAAFQFRRRLMLERILYIYLRETLMKSADQSTARSVEETISYLSEHYMLPLTLPMLAKRAGVSEGHYTVLFKKMTGRTMTSYLRSLRIQKAQQLFTQTSLTAKEVAGKVGFSDYFYFSRMFKMETGISPSAYQQRQTPEI
ncbi:AraC family transcriptional regulator [Paenibacillus sp. NEAU-GSW1]|uniref:AraC family transcriptional regulator n=1 Tax=Paenibacillus sp. NEAU-GSW1 TaxID=2682486 RepID=UPI0012E1E596|nr:AraC family transcriptional regulator [Paenibacillus sp. NEAU-GSW1]MUT66096.1 helix-turn-helix domain-containing protein [Paenibacillus sp. NEAU-GSW1]